MWCCCRIFITSVTQEFQAEFLSTPQTHNKIASVFVALASSGSIVIIRDFSKTGKSMRCTCQQLAYCYFLLVIMYWLNLIVWLYCLPLLCSNVTFDTWKVFILGVEIMSIWRVCRYGNWLRGRGSNLKIKNTVVYGQVYTWSAWKRWEIFARKAGQLHCRLSAQNHAFSSNAKSFTFCQI